MVQTEFNFTAQKQVQCNGNSAGFELKIFIFTMKMPFLYHYSVTFHIPTDLKIEINSFQFQEPN